MEERGSEGVVRKLQLPCNADRAGDADDSSVWRTELYTATSPDDSFGYGRSGSLLAEGPWLRDQTFPERP